MDQNQLNELRELVEFLKANEIAEFDMEQPDFKVRLKFAGVSLPAAATSLDISQLSQLLSSRQAGEVSSQGSIAAAAYESDSNASPAVPSVLEEALHTVKSPIVGTFYESPSPGASAFIKLGEQVEVGQVLCIIEAMKLMNEIEADVAGEVVKRVAASGQPVEYGQPLFLIRPR